MGIDSDGNVGKVKQHMLTSCNGMIDASAIGAHQVLDRLVGSKINGVRGAYNQPKRRILSTDCESGDKEEG